jgi:hypothetical protein
MLGGMSYGKLGYRIIAPCHFDADLFCSVFVAALSCSAAPLLCAWPYVTEDAVPAHTLALS